ncbi:putative 2,4-dichlorophenol 6-monooxygenase, partial [Teratosphaeria destructans]
MNTGIHDVSALAWRLAGVLKGWFRAGVLETYSTERHASAAQLIENDKVVSMLIAGKKPEGLQEDPRDPMVLLDEAIESQAAFASGLGIAYPPSFLNDVQGSDAPINITPGHRAPDVHLHKPGSPHTPTRLYTLTPYTGRFHILIFAGDPHTTRPQLRTLHHDLAASPRFAPALTFLTLIAGTANAIDEYLGVGRFGNGYWDPEGAAHARYGIGRGAGGIVVVRPDGILGFQVGLGGWARVRGPEEEEEGERRGEGLGEFLGQNEGFLAMPGRGEGEVESVGGGHV